jgi:hypothetical protein
MTGGNRRKGILNLYVALDTGLDDVDISQSHTRSISTPHTESRGADSHSVRPTPALSCAGQQNLCLF